MNVRVSAIRALEQRWTRAVADRDTETLDALLADDFLLIWIDGRIIRKAEILAGTAARKIDIEPFTSEDVELRLFGDAAVATGRALLKMKLNGQVEVAHFRHTEVFSRLGPGWKAISAQSVLICPPKSYFEGPTSGNADDHEGDVVGRAALQNEVEKDIGRDVQREACRDREPLVGILDGGA